jgi:hypothetical protein
VRGAAVLVVAVLGLGLGGCACMNGDAKSGGAATGGGGSEGDGVAGAGRGGRVGPAPVPVREVTTFEELKAAAGLMVRVRGPVQHEKLGDSVVVDGLDILCPDLRLPDGVTEAVLEGRLELWSPPVAETNDKGEISQGVTAETRRWVLRDCTPG